MAAEGGGALQAVTVSSVTLMHNIGKFINNSAQYGGAIFLDTTAVMVNNSNDNYINLKNNVTRILGNSVYQDVAELCNSSCLYNRVSGLSNKLIATPP